MNSNQRRKIFRELVRKFSVGETVDYMYSTEYLESPTYKILEILPNNPYPPVILLDNGSCKFWTDHRNVRKI